MQAEATSARAPRSSKQDSPEHQHAHQTRNSCPERQAHLWSIHMHYQWQHQATLKSDHHSRPPRVPRAEAHAQNPGPQSKLPSDKLLTFQRGSNAPGHVAEHLQAACRLGQRRLQRLLRVEELSRSFCKQAFPGADHGRTEGAGRCLARRFEAIFCPRCGLELCIRTGNMQAKNYISEEIFASGDAECILSPPFPLDERCGGGRRCWLSCCNEHLTSKFSEKLQNLVREFWYFWGVWRWSKRRDRLRPTISNWKRSFCSIAHEEID